MAVTTKPERPTARRARSADVAKGRIGGRPARPQDAAGNRIAGRVQEAGPAGPDQEPGHVRGRGRRRAVPRTRPSATLRPTFNWTIVVWLWLTVVFANLAEAVAEGRGKAQAETLRKTKRETVARRLVGWQPGQTDVREEPVPGTQLHARRPRGRRGRRDHSRRRRRRRGRGLGRRVGHHRRVGPGHPRVRR